MRYNVRTVMHLRCASSKNGGDTFARRRCSKNANHFRDGYAVCWDHSKIKRFRPHPDAPKAQLANSAALRGVLAGVREGFRHA